MSKSLTIERQQNGDDYRTKVDSGNKHPCHRRWLFDMSRCNYKASWHCVRLHAEHGKCYLRLSKLLDVVTRPVGSNRPEDNDVDAARNADMFADIIECLDDRSLTLVMRDAKDDGRKMIQMNAISAKVNLVLLPCIPN